MRGQEGVYIDCQNENGVLNQSGIFMGQSLVVVQMPHFLIFQTAVGRHVQ